MFVPEAENNKKTQIKVIGIGTAGVKTVDHFVKTVPTMCTDTAEIDVFAVHHDAQKLNNCKVNNKIQINTILPFYGYDRTRKGTSSLQWTRFGRDNYWAYVDVWRKAGF